MTTTGAPGELPGPHHHEETTTMETTTRWRVYSADNCVRGREVSGPLEEGEARRLAAELGDRHELEDFWAAPEGTVKEERLPTVVRSRARR